MLGAAERPGVAVAEVGVEPSRPAVLGVVEIGPGALRQDLRDQVAAAPPVPDARGPLLVAALVGAGQDQLGDLPVAVVRGLDDLAQVTLGLGDADRPAEPVVADHPATLAVDLFDQPSRRVVMELDPAAPGLQAGELVGGVVGVVRFDVTAARLRPGCRTRRTSGAGHRAGRRAARRRRAARPGRSGIPGRRRDQPG